MRPPAQTGHVTHSASEVRIQPLLIPVTETEPPPPVPGWRRAVNFMLIAGSCSALWLLLPQALFVFNDDFGYLRSIVRTIQHGQLWTDDWLEPWSASLSALGWGMYSLTHHFAVSMRLIQFGSLFASGLALHRLFAPRTSTTRAALAAILILSIPTLLYRFAEFGGMMVYVPCLLWGIHFAIRERWAGFTVCTVLALGSRQGAIAWLAIPSVHALGYLRQRRPDRLPACLLPVGASLVAYMLLGHHMNRSYAQVVMTGDMWRSLSASRLMENLLGCLPVLFIGPGLAMIFLRFTCPKERKGIEGDTPSPTRKDKLRKACILALSTICLCICLFAKTRHGIGFEHPLYTETGGRLWLGLLGLLAILGLGATLYVQQSLPFLIAAAGSLTLVCLRGAIYDYYCIDTVSFAMAASLALNRPLPSEENACSYSPLRLARAILLSGLVVLSAASTQRLWRHLNEMATRVQIAETALQKGLITEDELGVAPFGLQGWHLFPHFVSHEGARGDYIANFQNYLRPEAIVLREVRADLSSSAETLSVKLGPLSSRRYFQLERRLPRPSAPWPINPTVFQSEPFPLTEAAWNTLLSNPPPSPTKLPTSS